MATVLRAFGGESRHQRPLVVPIGDRAFGKLCPGIGAQSGTHFPNEALAETASRNQASEWDVLSLWTYFGNCVPEFGT